MSFYDCMSAVVTALGRQITVNEFDALYQRLLDEKDRLFRQGYPSDWLSAAQAVAQQIEIEKAIAQRQVLKNKLVHADAKAFIETARRTVDAGMALEARLVGVNTPIEGGRMSVAAEAHGLWTTSAGALLADLRRAGGGDRLVRLFSDRGFELEIAKALRGEPAHEDARLIAAAIDKVRDDLRRQENDAGGWRGRLDGYVTHQSHDSLRVRRAGFDRWRESILPMLDPDRTFGRDEDLLLQLRQERGQVQQHQLAAGAELQATSKEISRLNRNTEGRERYHDKRSEEAAANFETALNAFLNLAESAPPADRLAARQELNKWRYELRRRLDRASAGRQHPVLDQRLETLADLAEKAERSVDLLGELAAKLLEYDGRLRGPVDPDTFLRSLYNHIAADTWLRGSSDEFKGLLAEIGPANIARRRAAHRELHFKSANDEVAYMRQYGAGGLADGVLREIEGAGHAIALMRGLGSNPEAMFALLRTELMAEAKETGDNALSRAVSRKRLDWQLAEVTGASRQAANPTIAAWSSAIRTVQSMAKLGGAMLSSFGDIATAAAELRWQGRGALDSYRDMFDGLVKGRRDGERRIVADLLGVGFESLTGQVLARIGGESAPPGGLTRASALFFRLNGLSWWTDTHKTTAGLVIARYFAAERGKSFGQLPDRMQGLLRQYRLDDVDWNILRQSAVHAAEDGTEFLTIEGIKALPPDAFLVRGPLQSERALFEARDRLASAYGALVADRVDYAIPSPGAREQAVLHMGTSRGDVLGEALRFIMQFKSFPVGMATKTLGRDIYGGPGGGLSASARIMWLAFQLTIFGYLSMTAKELIAGKKPRDPGAPDTWAAAMMQGGGAGIYGDFVFGEFNRFGRSALNTAAGPTFGTADDLFTLWAKTRTGGKASDLAASALRLMVSNTPFASLFWLRPAINYLALYPIQEGLNPGYLRRMERRIERENKQTFWLSPNEAVK